MTHAESAGGGSFWAWRARLCELAIWTLGIVCVALPAQGATRQVLRGHVPRVVPWLAPVGRLPESNRLELAIGLPLRNRAELAALLNSLYNPGSPQFHHFLSVEQFTERFGPAEADYNALIDFVRAHGLEIRTRHPNRVVLDVSGTVRNIEDTFNTTLRTYPHPTDRRVFYAPDAEPSLDLDAPVLTVSGLDNYVLPRPMSLRVKERDEKPQLTGSGPFGFYLGGDFRAAYARGTTMTGAGQAVGLLEFGAGFYTNDIVSYEIQAGLPNVPVQPVLLNNYNGAGGSMGANAEVSLDIEMAISMAPGLSQVLVYEGTNTDSILCSMAATNFVKQFGASWTYPVDSTSDDLFQEMALQGQSFFNASGDEGAYASPEDMPTPAGDTNITIVGATVLSTAGPTNRWVAETVWRNGAGRGSSGGVSSNAIPPWQQGVNTIVNGGSNTQRNTPDVAMAGDNIWIYCGNGQSEVVAGTSCATPLWAAFMALVNQQAAASGLPSAGFINPAIYNIGTNGPGAPGNYTNCFHDITSGSNTNSSSPSLYFACPGYDLCTGWGTPAGASLINALAPPPSLQLGDAAYANGSFQFAVSNANANLMTSAEASQIQVFATTNLATGLNGWTPLTNLLLMNGLLQVNDTQSASWPQRLYRAVWVP